MTPEREQAIRESVASYRERGVTAVSLSMLVECLAALDAERAAHAQTRARLMPHDVGYPLDEQGCCGFCHDTMSGYGHRLSEARAELLEERAAHKALRAAVRAAVGW